MFADDLTWLTNSPGWAIATFVLSMIITVYFAVISFRDRNIRFALRTNNLMRDVSSTKMPGATLTFKGYDKPIENLSVTRLVLWNAGKGGVKAEDVVQGTPLTIRISEQGTVILSIGIIEYNLPSNLNKFDCQKAPDGLSARVDFDFMDHNQGIVVQIFHTGVSHKGISVDGYIKGMGKPKYKFVPGGNRILAPLPVPSAKKGGLITARRVRMFMGGLAAAVPFLIGGCLTLMVNTPPPSTAVKLEDVAIPVSYAIVVTSLFSVLFWALAYVLLRPGVPKELSVFEEEF